MANAFRDLPTGTPNGGSFLDVVVAQYFVGLRLLPVDGLTKQSCASCGMKRRLTYHHWLFGRKRGCSWRNNPINLVAVCDTCHGLPSGDATAPAFGSALHREFREEVMRRYISVYDVGAWLAHAPTGLMRTPDFREAVMLYERLSGRPVWP